MWTDTDFARRFRLARPIVQGPFGGGLSTAALTAAASRAGCLGSYGANALEPAQIRTVADEVRHLAGDKPFAFNLWVNASAPHADGEQVLSRAVERMVPFYDELGVQIPVGAPQALIPDFEAQVDAVLRADVPVLSFVFGVPSAAVLQACRERGVLTIGTATTVEEARLLDEAGVDAIVATGFEAGGHRASFVAVAEDCLTGSISLVPQVVDAVRVPVLAAGGIADGRGVAAALALGASGVQIGSAFLACEESGAPGPHREALFDAGPNDTTLTRVFSGRLLRAIRNPFISSLQAHAGDFAGYPLQNWLTSALRRAAAAQGRSDMMSLQAGQSTRLIRHRKASELIDAIVEDTTAVIERMGRGRG